MFILRKHEQEHGHELDHGYGNGPWGGLIMEVEQMKSEDE
jgi:hypothetical protein